MFYFAVEAGIQVLVRSFGGGASRSFGVVYSQVSLVVGCWPGKTRPSLLATSTRAAGPIWLARLASPSRMRASE